MPDNPAITPIFMAILVAIWIMAFDLWHLSFGICHYTPVMQRLPSVGCRIRVYWEHIMGTGPSWWSGPASVNLFCHWVLSEWSSDHPCGSNLWLYLHKSVPAGQYADGNHLCRICVLKHWFVFSHQIVVTISTYYSMVRRGEAHHDIKPTRVTSSHLADGRHQ